MAGELLRLTLMIAAGCAWAQPDCDADVAELSRGAKVSEGARLDK